MKNVIEKSDIQRVTWLQTPTGERVAPISSVAIGLGISRQRVFAMAKRGTLITREVNGKRYVTRESVERRLIGRVKTVAAETTETP